MRRLITLGRFRPRGVVAAPASETDPDAVRLRLVVGCVRRNRRRWAYVQGPAPSSAGKGVMRTRMIAVLIGLPLALTGCGNQNAGGSTPGKENFEERARQAIAAWEALGKAKAWTSGFVPLEEFT